MHFLISSMSIVVCLITTLFVNDIFEIKDVKEIEPALKIVRNDVTVRLHWYINEMKIDWYKCLKPYKIEQQVQKFLRLSS